MPGSGSSIESPRPGAVQKTGNGGFCLVPKQRIEMDSYINMVQTKGHFIDMPCSLAQACRGVVMRAVLEASIRT